MPFFKPKDDKWIKAGQQNKQQLLKQNKLPIINCGFLFLIISCAMKFNKLDMITKYDIWLLVTSRRYILIQFLKGCEGEGVLLNIWLL